MPEPQEAPKDDKDQQAKYDATQKEHRRRAAAAAATIGGRLATWARSLIGKEAADVDPNHGWRHWFKTEGRERMNWKKLDAIQGHISPSAGAKYGEYPPRVTGPEIAKLPRIEIDEAPRKTSRPRNKKPRTTSKTRVATKAPATKSRSRPLRKRQVKKSRT
jgi:hypothetical protein